MLYISTVGEYLQFRLYFFIIDFTSLYASTICLKSGGVIVDLSVVFILLFTKNSIFGIMCFFVSISFLCILFFEWIGSPS